MKSLPQEALGLLDALIERTAVGTFWKKAQK